MVLTRSKANLYSELQINQRNNSVDKSHQRMRETRKISKNKKQVAQKKLYFSQRKQPNIRTKIRKSIPKFILNKAKGYSWVRTLVSDVIERLARVHEKQSEAMTSSIENKSIISAKNEASNELMENNTTNDLLSIFPKIEDQDFFIFEPSLELQATIECRNHENVFLRFYRPLKRIVKSTKFTQNAFKKFDSEFMNQYFSLYEVSALVYEYSKSLKKQTLLDFERIKAKYQMENRTIYDIADKLNKGVKLMSSTDLEDLLKVLQRMAFSSRVIFVSDLPQILLPYVHKDKGKSIVDIVNKSPPIINLCEDQTNEEIGTLTTEFIINDLKEHLLEIINIKKE